MLNNINKNVQVGKPKQGTHVLHGLFLQLTASPVIHLSLSAAAALPVWPRGPVPCLN